jgi:hypothetical protein
MEGFLNTIVVNKLATLFVGQGIFIGNETDVSRPVYLDWRTTGTPLVTDGDAVKATVDSKGNFSATVTIDHAGTQSSMFAGSSGAMTKEWSATPIVQASTTPPPSGGSTGGATTPVPKAIVPLGVYLDGQPDKSSAANQAYFEQQYNAFVKLMGARPSLYNGFTDNSKGAAGLPGSAAYGAGSFAQTGAAYVGPTSGTIPLIGVPMSDPSAQYSTVDTYYKEVIAGNLDADYTGIVDAWAKAGFKTTEFRVGYEFNGSMAWTPASNGSNNADFVAAWQHIANLIHTQGSKDGIKAETVWNPATANGSSYDIQSLYLGDQYVDVISSDAYGGGHPNNLVDYATDGKTIDSSYAVWASKPANLEHYFLYENATTSNAMPALGATGPTGYGWSVEDTIAMAKLHHKPFGIDESGGALGQDDTTTAVALAQAVAAAKPQGVTVDHISLWALGNNNFNFLGEKFPNEAAALAKNLGGTGPAPVSTSPNPPSTTPPATNTVTVIKPSSLAVGLDTIAGMETDPSQAVFLNWRTTGTPAKSDGDWVKATVDSKGNFSAAVTIDHAGTQSGLFYYAGSGAVTEAWVATPH